MNNIFRIFFILVFLTTSGLCQDIVTVKFNCTPSDAIVSSLNEQLEWEVLGRADQEISFDAQKFTLFLFSSEGYQDREEAIASVNFNSGKWPQSGTLDLVPSTFTWLKLLFFRFGWLLLLPIPLLRQVQKWRKEKAENEERLVFLENLQMEAKQTKDDVLGQRLGKYLLTSFLGQGGMAVVYSGLAGKDHKTGEQVAVKVLSAVAKDESIERFHREVKICQKLIHPNIVSIYDWGKDGELIYLAMELIQGGSLEERMKEGVDYREALRLFDEVLAGMEFAHAQGVTHRDLKPDNIMLTDSGRVKITDFGLAKLQTIKTVTVTGSVMGTPAYMAPEQIQGEDPSPSMDQYALGILAFELFTGRLPFDSTDMMAVITMHLIEEPPHPHTVKEDLPEPLCDLIIKMLQKDPGDRFADLTEVRAALKALP